MRPGRPPRAKAIDPLGRREETLPEETLPVSARCGRQHPPRGLHVDVSRLD